ncbi:MAG TPA: pyruvate kinase [Clostridia bacterium]|nr:pyruvate kinase [Clostridia bacterium]
MRKTKIICTVGPVSEKPEILKDLIQQGANVIRLNFSHGDHEEHGKRIDLIKKIRDEMKVPVAILIDIKGPEIRIGKFRDDKASLKEGQNFVLTTSDVEGDETKVSVYFEGIIDDVSKGTTILIDDGLIELSVDNIIGDEVHCKVINGGILENGKSVNIPGVSISLPSITPKDIEDIKFGISREVDYIAISFVRKIADVLDVKRILETNNGGHIKVISKIENQEGLENIDNIIKISDGIMVARGDLGVEIPIEDVPIAQKSIIKKCNNASKPVIIATQMLDSMIRNPRPTRAETSDVANAIYDGTDAIMLSGETAMGKYPLESLLTMATIARRVESSINYVNEFEKRIVGEQATVTNSISHATCSIAHDLQAKAIITATQSGDTARMVSKYRPASHIIATTTSKNTYSELALVWGVWPYISPDVGDTDKMIDKSIEIATKTENVNVGDVVVITAGVPVGMSGSTNLIKVNVIGDILSKGTGIGTGSAFGRVCIVNSVMDARMKFQDGDIIVTSSTDNSLLPFMKKASAIITEESGITSHAAIVGISLEIPTIVDAQEITKILHDGMCVTIDPIKGFIYNGRAQAV